MKWIKNFLGRLTTGFDGSILHILNIIFAFLVEVFRTVSEFLQGMVNRRQDDEDSDINENNR